MLTFHRRGRGEGSRERGEQALPLGAARRGAWVRSPALRGRFDWGGVQAPSQSLPLLPAPCSPASFDFFGRLKCTIR